MEASALKPPPVIARPSGPRLPLRLRSDEQLVQLFRDGDDAAFHTIHDRYRTRLLAYARQMLPGAAHEAEDVLQDVFIRAYSALRADDREMSLKAWLYRITHNRCIDHHRRPVLATTEDLELEGGSCDEPASRAERREELRRLIEDVRRLPDQQRSALLMREMNGLTYDELAGALDTTVPAIKSLLVRARMGLVEAAEAREVACSEVRHQLASANDRGVRVSGQARRHMRDCAPCREYRRQIRGVRRRLAALSPGAGPLGLFANLGFSGSAAGGGAATAGGGGGLAATVGGSGAAITVGKVAAIVASVAVVGAGAGTEVEHLVSPAPPHHAHHAARAVAEAAPVMAADPAVLDAPPGVPPAVAAATDPAPRATDPSVTTDPPAAAVAGTTTTDASGATVSTTATDPAAASGSTTATAAGGSSTQDSGTTTTSASSSSPDAGASSASASTASAGTPSASSGSGATSGASGASAPATASP